MHKATNEFSRQVKFNETAMKVSHLIVFICSIERICASGVVHFHEGKHVITNNFATANEKDTQQADKQHSIESSREGFSFANPTFNSAAYFINIYIGNQATPATQLDSSSRSNDRKHTSIESFDGNGVYNEQSSGLPKHFG